MSDNNRFLALWLDAPMQSWGFESQFERRGTGLFPTKSGIAGLLCAAAGYPKGSPEESKLLAVLRNSAMLAIAVPASDLRRFTSRGQARRLVDYHTVLDTRRADNTPNNDPVVTRREYLLHARFGVVLNLPADWAQKIAGMVQNPVWGIWFGRKCCIPAAPLYRGVWESEEDGVRSLLLDQPLKFFTTVRDAAHFESATDTLPDQPVSFGSPESSGSHLRQHSVRRIVLSPAENRGPDERPAPASEDPG